MISRVLAFETSCDDTSVAIVDDGLVRSCLSLSQDAVHARFGGIVPEIASRNHTDKIIPLVEDVLAAAGLSLDDIDAIAATSRPGLIGSLMTGLVSAKSLALALEKPFLGVHHIEGHVFAPFLRDALDAPPARLHFPLVAFVVSGGHTSIFHCPSPHQYQLLGETADDAAGEAIDKFAKLVGLGFPGGARVDRWAQYGDTRRFSFPRARTGSDLEMSFSGLKSAALRMWNGFTAAQKELIDDEIKSPLAPGLLADLCASYQWAVVDVLMDRFEKALRFTGVSSAVISGGVSANSLLRRKSQRICDDLGVTLGLPPPRYCTDNAAMIGLAALSRFRRGETSPWSLGAVARAPLAEAESPPSPREEFP